MKRLALVGAVLLAACGGPAEDPGAVGYFDLDSLDSSLVSGGQIKGHYIVTLKEGASPAAFTQARGIQATFHYDSALNGFAAWLPPGLLSQVLADPSVAMVEEDGVATINAETVPYGIVNVGANVSSVQAGNGSGTVTGPTAFVIDTGVQAHVDLNRVGHVNYASGKNDDCHGHGTHVAGTIGAKDTGSGVVGVAPGVAVFGVKVLNCQGSGAWSSIISGMNFVAGHSASQKVANMSLGGGFNSSVNAAAANMVNGNVAVAVAAGNDGGDASTHSPASEPSVLTVAAHDANNVNASWSNFGSLVDVSAPGVSVYSTYKGGGYATMSGTSMASPHTAGALTIYRANNPGATGAQAIAAVKANTSGTSSRGFGRVWVGNW